MALLVVDLNEPAFDRLLFLLQLIYTWCRFWVQNISIDLLSEEVFNLAGSIRVHLDVLAELSAVPVVLAVVHIKIWVSKQSVAFMGFLLQFAVDAGELRMLALRVVDDGLLCD